MPNGTPSTNPAHTQVSETENRFYDQPILNSPYERPRHHWELDGSNRPTNRIVDSRRPSAYVSPIPKPRKRHGEQLRLVTDETAKAIATDDQQYDLTRFINGVRQAVDRWRSLPESAWRVTPETARLLRHWRSHAFSDIRPFFCQVEAVETLIWLTEVAPKAGKAGREYLDHLEDANSRATADEASVLNRVALKLATGAGKTTVMALLIAWQTVNAVRHPGSPRFTRGFLVVTPGVTIRQRLRVLQPNDPDSYYASRELVPGDMLRDLEKARIVITNYHAFQRRETLKLSAGGRALLQGRGPAVATRETEGQMLQRVMPELMGLKRLFVLNDEAHHCYREKPDASVEGKLKGEELKEAKKNIEKARVWISGLEVVRRKLGVQRVVDLSATPFFLRGSGYAEGTLFPWTASDFSLMDAIECGIVKLPRVPVADNIPGAEVPVFRELWKHIGKDMPKKKRGQKSADPLQLPTKLQTALDALYGHYRQTFEQWREAGIRVPPCFIVVCNNTATSKLVYDYISGFRREAGDGPSPLVQGRLPLFRNFDDDGTPLSRPHTLLIDSEQLDSGLALNSEFRTAAADEIERFRREIVQRTGDRRRAERLSDEDLLREVVNTVGVPGRLGEQVRCVVSVSMLSEGWDARTVTHVLGVRAFGTQLLCEQIVGRALRRQSYHLNDESGLFDVEYADVLGIPFDFTGEPVVVKPKPPIETVQVKAVTPERDACEIRFPRVQGYRVELPDDRLTAKFDDDSTMKLTPELVGPSRVRVEGVIGEGVDLTLVHTNRLRRNTLLYHLTRHLLDKHWRDPNDEPRLYLFGQLKRIARQWLDRHLVCVGGTYPAQLMYLELADMACERITNGIVEGHRGDRPITAMLDAYNPDGSTRHVRFTTSKKIRWETAENRCHVNWAVCDGTWEAEFCRVAETHPRVRAYVKNQNLGLEIPYRYGAESRRYIPDFVLLVDDGRGPDDPLHLVVEIKGYRREDAKVKAATMKTYWIPSVNHLRTHGRWAFREFTDVYEMETDFGAAVAARIDEAVGPAVDA